MRTKAETKRLYVAAAKEWRHRATALGCRVCPQLGQICEGYGVHAHHVTRAQVLRRYVSAVAYEQYLGVDETADLERKLLFDHRNSLGICPRAHSRHHSRLQPIPFELVPLSAIAFAAELGLGWTLEREYPSKERMVA